MCIMCLCVHVCACLLEAQAEVEVSYDSVINIETMPALEQQEQVSFRDLGIKNDVLLANVKALGIKTPTDVRLDVTFLLLIFFTSLFTCVLDLVGASFHWPQCDAWLMNEQLIGQTVGVV